MKKANKNKRKGTWRTTIAMVAVVAAMLLAPSTSMGVFSETECTIGGDPSLTDWEAMVINRWPAYSSSAKGSDPSINTTYPVMPNSIFEPVTNARDAKASAADVVFDPDKTTYMHEEVSLNGVWKYKPDADGVGEGRGWHSSEYDDGAWAQMKVPSNFGVEDNSIWNFTDPIWFRYHFASPTNMNGKYVKLVFEGVDYLADIWLNGKKLGHHEGFFCPFQFDVSHQLSYYTENVLAVKVVSPIDPQIRDPLITTSTKTIPKGVLNHHDSRPGATINAQLSQTMVTGGVFRPVKLVASGDVKIDWIFITPLLKNNYASADIIFDYILTNCGTTEKAVSLVTVLDGVRFTDRHKISANAILRPGSNKISLRMNLDSPKLWFPWDHPELGMPDLYNAETYVLKNGICLDNQTNQFGVREIKLGGQQDSNNDKRTGTDAYHWYVNGRKIFVKGTNLIPTEWMASVDKNFCERECSLLKGANMNMVRIHAHVQPPVLLDTFDEQGILLWQDFSLQWRYIDNDEFIDTAKRMMAEMVYLIYNHPSAVLWCCHNEPTWAFLKGIAWTRYLPIMKLVSIQSITSDDMKLDDELYAVATGIDKTRPSHKGSGYGDNHSYAGWYSGVFTDAYDYKDAFSSEFGAQGVTYSIQRWMPKEYLWPPNDDKENDYPWHYHCAQLSNQCTYIGDTESYESFNDFAFASQLYQAELIKYCIEHYRIDKYNPTGGMLQFQFTNWWPSIAWGIVDYDERPLLAYKYAANAYEPVHVCTSWKDNIIGSGQTVDFPVYAINDRHDAFGDAIVKWKLVEETDSFIIRGNRQASPYDQAVANPVQNPLARDPVTVCRGSGNAISEIASGSKIISLQGDQVLKIDDVVFSAPATDNIRHFSLYLTLETKNGIRSENSYHFVVVDDPNNFNPPYGISPKPQFDLTIKLVDVSGKPIAGASIVMKGVYNEFSSGGQTNELGTYTFSGQKPDAYDVAVNGKTEKTIDLSENTVLNMVFMVLEKPGDRASKGIIPGFEGIFLLTAMISIIILSRRRRDNI